MGPTRHPLDGLRPDGYYRPVFKNDIGLWVYQCIFPCTNFRVSWNSWKAREHLKKYHTRQVLANMEPSRVHYRYKSGRYDPDGATPIPQVQPVLQEPSTPRAHGEMLPMTPNSSITDGSTKRPRLSSPKTQRPASEDPVMTSTPDDPYHEDNRESSSVAHASHVIAASRRTSLAGKAEDSRRSTSSIKRYFPEAPTKELLRTFHKRLCLTALSLNIPIQKLSSASMTLTLRVLRPGYDSHGLDQQAIQMYQKEIIDKATTNIIAEIVSAYSQGRRVGLVFDVVQYGNSKITPDNSKCIRLGACYLKNFSFICLPLNIVPIDHLESGGVASVINAELQRLADTYAVEISYIVGRGGTDGIDALKSSEFGSPGRKNPILLNCTMFEISRLLWELFFKAECDLEEFTVLCRRAAEFTGKGGPAHEEYRATGGSPIAETKSDCPGSIINALRDVCDNWKFIHKAVHSLQADEEKWVPFICKLLHNWVYFSFGTQEMENINDFATTLKDKECKEETESMMKILNCIGKLMEEMTSSSTAFDVICATRRTVCAIKNEKCANLLPARLIGSRLNRCMQNEPWISEFHPADMTEDFAWKSTSTRCTISAISHSKRLIYQQGCTDTEPLVQGAMNYFNMRDPYRSFPKSFLASCRPSDFWCLYEKSCPLAAYLTTFCVSPSTTWCLQQAFGDLEFHDHTAALTAAVARFEESCFAAYTKSTHDSDYNFNIDHESVSEDENCLSQCSDPSCDDDSRVSSEEVLSASVEDWKYVTHDYLTYFGPLGAKCVYREESDGCDYKARLKAVYRRKSAKPVGYEIIFENGQASQEKFSIDKVKLMAKKGVLTFKSVGTYLRAKALTAEERKDEPSSPVDAQI